MQKFITRFMVAASMLLCYPTFAQAQAKHSASEPIPGVVRVKMQRSMVESLGSTPRRAPKGKALTTGIDGLDSSLRQIKGLSLRKVFPCPPGREAAHTAFGLDQWYEVVFDETVNPLEARRILSEAPGVEKSTVRRPMKLFDNNPIIPVGSVGTKAKAPASAMPFNDPRLPAQWHYYNDGSISGSVRGADINLFEAWKVTTGSKDVVVAVIDGGIDTNHEDLHDAMWINTGEIPDNGIDDDGNGYVDDYYGYNFCTNEGKVYPHEHGTHVGGTIGAINNNGIGVCGVAGGDVTPGTGVRLMSVQVFDTRTGVGSGDFARAIIYAADNGATIANCSWGWEDDGYYEDDVLDAIRYFTQHARSNNMTGGLLIFAAGNTGETGDFYPQCMPEVLSVASISCDGRTTTYSSYGKWVDVAAPGGLLDFTQLEGILSTMPDNNYGYQQGTSMAAPHVTGIAALILSKYGSSSLTNETLRVQLETSVNDLTPNNPEHDNLYGSGYIDAVKSLQWADGTAPGIPSDIRVMPAQDEILIEWTIPASSDNNVNNHILYYSKTPFDASSDLSKIKTVVIDTKYYNSGDKFIYELNKLEPMTDYYIALKAVNRWGNASALSEVIKTATGRGPHMEVDLTGNLNITSDASHRIAATPFNIINNDEGFLKWESQIRGRSHSISSYSLADKMTTVPYQGKLATMAASEYQVSAIEDYVTNDYPQTIQTAMSLRGFIGDTDPDVPNSLAQMFTVSADEFPNGFNLTAIYMMGLHGQNPIIEIYRGPAMMSESTLILRDTPSAFSYNTSISLSEQIYFEPGESFYIVVHFPQPQKEMYPLGLGYTNGAPFANKAYFSTDLGKTWTLLAQALKGSQFEDTADLSTWAVRAISQNPDFSSMISLDPCQGQVKPGESQRVDVTVDGSKLINGTYRANIRFKTNETEENSIVIPVNVTVKEHQPDIMFNDVVDFGSLIIGQSKTITVEIFNRGYDKFANRYGQLTSSNISCTSDQFKAPTYLGAGFPARSKTSFNVTFTPTVGGSHSAQLIFTAASGKQVKVMLQGTATEAAKIAINPENGVEVGNLTVGGESKEVTFDIKNEGRYPLQFLMPKFTNEKIDGVAGGLNHRFGYSWATNIGGDTSAEYSPMPDLIDPVNVASRFGDYEYWSEAIDLGFDFPYYGETFNKIYIMAHGALAFSPYKVGSIYPPLDKESYLYGCGMISAFGATQLMMGPDSRVEYGKLNGKFYVNYKDVLALIYDKRYTPISFHIMLDPSGDIEMSYDSFNPGELFQESYGLFIALNDFEVEDPIVYTSHTIANNYDGDPSKWTEAGERYRQIGSGSVVRFIAPKPNMIQSIEPVMGIIAPGESTPITAVVKASDAMNAGPIFNNLVVLSNDPKNSSINVRFNADIIGDLHPEFTLETPSVDFGDVFRTGFARRPVIVKNSGRAPMELQSVTLAAHKFDFSLDLPVTIQPGQSLDIMVDLPTVNEGAVSDVMTIVTDAGTKTAEIMGTVIGCPEMHLSYSSIDETLDYGVAKPMPLTVTNSGNATLAYTVTTGEHFIFRPEFADDSKVSYTYTASVDNPAAKREWFDIETNGLGTFNDVRYYMNHDYVEVELPFEFPFYDNKYSTMYVYGPGFISFNKRNDDHLWPDPPAEFPAGSVYTNLLAPYWGMHTMDETPTGGTYYYTTDDYAVVSWMEYGNSLNLGICFQAIIHKDGSFTYNYKPLNSLSIIYNLFGMVGISNIDGTDGVVIPERMVVFDNSINFTPVVKNNLAAGESTDLDITLVADRLAGDYTSKITVTSDDPATPKVEIPVTLKVIGHPKAVFPENAVITHPAGYQLMDLNDWWVRNGALYYHEFELVNDGSAAFTVDRIDVDFPQYKNKDAFTLFFYGEEEDIETAQMVVKWTTYQGQSYEVGIEPLRLAIPMVPGSVSNKVGTYVCKLTYHLSGLEGISTYVQTVTFEVTDVPVAFFDEDEIHVKNATDDTEIEKTVTLSNFGDYRLDYDFYLDLTGRGEHPEDQWNYGDEDEDLYAASLKAMALDTPTELIAQASIPASETKRNTKAKATVKDDNPFNTPQTSEVFSNYLYHPCPERPSQAFVVGPGNTYDEYAAATQYFAPEGGINISAIYTMLAPRGIEGKTLTAEIIAGDVSTGEVLGTGTYTIPAELEFGEGQLSFLTIRLYRPVYITEGQMFYVKITYPAGSARLVGLLSKSDIVVDDRYLIYQRGAGWGDIAKGFKDSYGSLGFIMTCLESRPGKPWVELLTEECAGSLEPYESADIKLRFNGASAPKDRDNKAMLVFHTTDPDQPIINYPLTLDRNVGPDISTDATNLFVKEGQKITATFVISDQDGDDFAFRLDDTNPMEVVSIKSVEAVDPTEPEIEINEYDPENHFWEILNTKAGAILTAELAPKHGSAGEYDFSIMAIDRNRNATTMVASYTVQHVNRAPQIVKQSAISLVLGTINDPIDLTTYFNDPDGDELTYSTRIATLGGNAPVDIYTTGASIVLVPKQVGSATLVVTATDPDGATATNRVSLTIKEASGIDDVTLDASTTLYPNPVVETLYVTTDFNAANAEYRIYSISGQLMISETADAVAGEAHAISVGHLAPGSYIFRLDADGRSLARVIVKN